MELKVIRSESEYQNIIAWIDDQFNKNIAPDSVQGKQLQIALLLIKQYEDQHYEIQ